MPSTLYNVSGLDAVEPHLRWSYIRHIGTDHPQGLARALKASAVPNLMFLRNCVMVTAPATLVVTQCNPGRACALTGMVRTRSVPWKRPNPRKRTGKATRHLSPAKKAAAKARARRAGRRYPNLVDNMRMAARKTAKKSAKKKSAKKRAGRSRATLKTSAGKRAVKRSGKPREKDPKGGLTSAGRKAFARKEGAHLRPGVTKKASEMTPQEMRRKGSWAVRFFGRKKLPPLVDRDGRPTRHALSAHAWGEPVPRTVTAARRIAMKGKRLLARYQRIK